MKCFHDLELPIKHDYIVSNRKLAYNKYRDKHSKNIPCKMCRGVNKHRSHVSEGFFEYK